jgi:ATP-dependent DNA helicase RecG
MEISPGSDSHPFSPLLGPLRYACQRQFARLSTVKSLRGSLEGALRNAQNLGAPEDQISSLRQELENVDDASPERRKEALRRIVLLLHRSGLALPEELQELVPVVESEPPADAARLLSIAPSSGPLATPLRSVGWRVNPRLLGTLYRRGVRTAGDVLFVLPRCYEDRRKMSRIAQLRVGERGVTVAKVRSADEYVIRGRQRRFKAILEDESGSIAAVYFHSGPWLKGRFPIGKRLVISGEVRASYSGWEMAHPEVEPADDVASSPIHFNRLVPIYSGLERLELSNAIRQIHFPERAEDLELLNRQLSPAHRRLAFDELFFLQLGILLRRQGIKAENGIAFKVTEEVLAKARSALPFSLTSAQARVVVEICRDMAKPEPMNRLLQGDVGSGKTAVASLAASIALLDGYQVALMAPTEILAEQHHRTLGQTLGRLGFEVALVTGAATAKRKRDVRQAIAEGRVHVAVGTHALIQEGVEFKRLGLSIIDEQHRFGVIQRHALMTKGRRPDVLVMTATPIPRTLAMTLYGDLEISVIDELPPGRTPIATKVFIEKQRPRAYAAMAEELAKGRQCYVVYPLVEESEKVDLADATRGAERLRELFSQCRVGLLHGRLKPEEKDAVMAEFRAGRIQILVCTTVVEVGVDVSNASVMVIEAAERFGLSQLHQLRGRVGRGAAKSHCLLIAGYARSKEASDRLSVMERSSDGFVIAEKDLELRGPGEFLGTRQSGLPELAVANLARDGALLATARDEARQILATDPRLETASHAGLVKALSERWGGRLALSRVG